MAGIVGAVTAKYRTWRLAVSEDPSFASTQQAAAVLGLEVVGQFPQQDFEDAQPREAIQTAGFGAPSKGTMPGAGGPRTMTFQAIFQASSNIDDIRPTAAALESMRNVDSSLGRPPVLLFQWAEIALRCWLTDLRIRWEGGVHVTGVPKRFTASITLTEAIDRPLDSTRQGDQPSTFYHVLRAGERPEHLALWYLGSPDLAPLVRRDPANVGLAWEPGDKVRILPRHNAAMRQQIKPAAPCFADYRATFAIYAAIANADEVAA